MASFTDHTLELCRAAANDDIKVVERLLKGGANVNLGEKNMA